jgi:WD40 repeat protein
MASYEHNVNLWSLGSLDSLKKFYGHGTEVWCVDISPDGRYIASGGMNGEVLLWSVASRSESSQIPGGFIAAEPAFSPDGKFVALSAKESGDIRILNLGDREEAYSIGSSAVPIRYSSDGTELLALSEDSIDFLDATTGSLKNQISLSFRLQELDPSPSIVKLAVSEDWLAIVDHDSNVRVISLIDGMERFTRKMIGVSRLALSVNGKRLAMASVGDRNR